MKKVLVILALVAMTGIASAANLNFTVNPAAAWNGYVNAFELDGATYATGFSEGTPSTASANWAPGLPLTMSPNTRLFDGTVGDLFWHKPDGSANKVIEYNYYQEVAGAVGDAVTFNFSTVTRNLPAGYTAVGFIKVLDGFASWATTQYNFVDLTAGNSGLLSFTVADAGAGSEIVQAGFAIKGIAVTASDPVALTGVTIVPEPISIALLGLGGLLLRRRK